MKTKGHQNVSEGYIIYIIYIIIIWFYEKISEKKDSPTKCSLKNDCLKISSIV